MAESETCILASTSLCNTHIHKNQGFSVLCPFSFPFSTLLLFIWFLQSHFLPGFKSRKAGEPEIKLPMSVGSSKKQESSRKPSTSALLTTPKPLTVEKLLHNKLENSERDGNTRPPDLLPEKSIGKSRSHC